MSSENRVKLLDLVCESIENFKNMDVDDADADEIDDNIRILEIAKKKLEDDAYLIFSREEGVVIDYIIMNNIHDLEKEIKKKQNDIVDLKIMNSIVRYRMERKGVLK